MSKPLNEMTKEELIYAISDILEREMDGWGRCRWCRAEEKPVNLALSGLLAAMPPLPFVTFVAGEEVSPEDADEYRIQHEPDCAVTYIEAVLAGTYKYVNEPAGRVRGVVEADKREAGE